MVCLWNCNAGGPKKLNNFGKMYRNLKGGMPKLIRWFVVIKGNKLNRLTMRTFKNQMQAFAIKQPIEVCRKRS